ncbi:MAG: phosphoglucosamine mutase [Actinobacteria bacterium]|nr:MAG: phosphoglucosamine mutase [Actinomycetota bacterium]
MTRQYFGTDGVRGVVGEDLTADLVERLGRAATLWCGRGRIFVGRDTRASGVELEAALARGIASVGGNAVVAGVLPTPAVALLTLDLGCVITASHNPPEYNGVKFFERDGQKLTDGQEEQIEALLDRPGTDGGDIDEVGVATDSYLEHVLERFGSDLTGLRIGVDCANGAYSGLAPKAFEQLGAQVTTIGNEPDGHNINVGCGATDLRALQQVVVRDGLDLGVAFDGDGDRMLAVDAGGAVVDGDQIVATLALHLRVPSVTVTPMTNGGFHELMSEHGIETHVTAEVGDRYVLESIRATGGKLGGEQSGHIIYLDGHVTGDGLVAALLLCEALEGRSLAEAAAVMRRHPQVKENVRVRRKNLSPAVLEAVAEHNEELEGRGRVLVRGSGTEPVVRVLAEARDEAEAATLCASIAALVRRELG